MDNLEKKHLKSKITRLTNELHRLKNPLPESTSQPYLMKYRLNTILQEADEAMERFSAKIRKETIKHAKQKQSQG